MKNILYFCTTLLTALIIFVSCDTKKPASTSTTGLMTIVCDESFQNILSQEIDVFEYTYPNANVIPYYVDEKSAIDSLLKFKTKIIITAHELNKKQVEYLKEEKGACRTQRIAVDAIALIVNKDNPLSVLSMSEIEEIMSGKVSRWNELAPSKLDSIRVIFDNQGSSTVQYMRDSVLRGAEFTKNVYAQKNNAEVFKAVSKRKDAIGIIGVSWISGDMKAKELSLDEKVKALQHNDTTTTAFDNTIKVLKIRRDDSVEAFQPYQAYIYDGSYPLYRNIYVISSGAGGSLAHGFYSFITGFTGQKIIQQTGVLPSVVRPRMVNLN
ncbi:MAG: substrate-binding domain-containing protein [Muribaculaceae bacterium]|nr:substrate-binding domain-containing protein [Muribaculaceae bacterium]